MTPDALLAYYERIADAPEAIARLRRFVLDLAVQGKLVPQESRDEPASVLVQRIVQERAKLLKINKQEKQRRAASCSYNIEGDRLPPGWHQVRLGDLIHLVSGQHLQPNEYTHRKVDRLPYVTGPSDFAPTGLQVTRSAVVRKAVAAQG